MILESNILSILRARDHFDQSKEGGCALLFCCVDTAPGNSHFVLFWGHWNLHCKAMNTGACPLCNHLHVVCVVKYLQMTKVNK